MLVLAIREYGTIIWDTCSKPDCSTRMKFQMFTCHTRACQLLLLSMDRFAHI